MPPKKQPNASASKFEQSKLSFGVPSKEAVVKKESSKRKFEELNINDPAEKLSKEKKPVEKENVSCNKTVTTTSSSKRDKTKPVITT
jgi:hypothetical protein